MKIKIKPLSVNQSWKGKRFKTKKYKKYETDLLNLLPKINIQKGKYYIEIVFGFSSILSDIDNPIKPFFDVLQLKYGINDRDIYEMRVKKEMVKKGFEFIDFEIIKIL